MTPWRLGAVLRLRVDAEERAALAHAQATAALRAAEAAASVAAAAVRSAAAQQDGATTSIASLRGGDAHRRALEERERTERARVGGALRELAQAREAHLEAHRAKRALELLRDREQARRRRAREAAAEEELADTADARRSVRR